MALDGPALLSPCSSAGPKERAGAYNPEKNITDFPCVESIPKRLLEQKRPVLFDYILEYFLFF